MLPIPKGCVLAQQMSENGSIMGQDSAHINQLFQKRGGGFLPLSPFLQAFAERQILKEKYQTYNSFHYICTSLNLTCLF